MRLTPIEFFDYLYQQRRLSDKEHNKLIKKFPKPTLQQKSSAVYWKSLNRGFHFVLTYFNKMGITIDTILKKYDKAEAGLDHLRKNIRDDITLNPLVSMTILTSFNEIQTKMLQLWQTEHEEDDDPIGP